MRPGREVDCTIAEHVFGHRVFVKKRMLFEETPKGDRPLHLYTKSMASAWEVAERLGIALIPVENGQWFALVGAIDGWKSPADFIEYLRTGKFVDSGAAVGESAPLVICLAAIKSIESRRNARASVETPTSPTQADTSKVH